MAKVFEKELEALPVPREIYSELDRWVVGQERAKRTLAIAAYNHLKRVHLRPYLTERRIRKSNVLLIGPTGSGKTHLARTLARILDLPFAAVDATEYTEAGYHGKDVEVMVGDLVLKADRDVERAGRGIVFVDEVDKIARRTQGGKTGAGTRDIGGEGVQQSLLKVIEGTELFVPTNVSQGWSWNKPEYVLVDTTDVLFICAGTFTDLQTAAGDGRSPGFRAGAGPEDEPDRPDRPAITHRELESFGMLAEFLARLPVRVELEPLTEADLCAILTDPPDALVRQYQDLFSLDGVELEVTPEALVRIASHALRQGYGARGLRTVVEDVFHDLMFDVHEHRGTKRVLRAGEVDDVLGS